VSLVAESSSLIRAAISSDSDLVESAVEYTSSRRVALSSPLDRAISSLVTSCTFVRLFSDFRSFLNCWSSRSSSLPELTYLISKARVFGFHRLLVLNFSTPGLCVRTQSHDAGRLKISYESGVRDLGRNFARSSSLSSVIRARSSVSSIIHAASFDSKSSFGMAAFSNFPLFCS